MKVVVVGSGGRLGGAITRRFLPNHRVVAFDRTALDLSRPEIIEDRLLPIDFDVIINAAAVTGVDYCEGHEPEAYAVNAVGPELIARICQAKGARMVQVSTDYVYDGVEPGEKNEAAELNPLGVYARSKFRGEQAVQAAADNTLVLRTAWIFGPDRPGFVDLMLNSAAESDVVAAIADKFASPTYSNDFAAWLERLLPRSPDGGTFNVCNSGSCSWREYAREAITVATDLGIELAASRVEPLLLAEMEAFLAPRPVHTAMSSRKLAAAIGEEIRPWQAALKVYIETFYGKP